MNEIKKKDSDLVVQSNALISSSSALSLNEKRLILKLISMINKNDEDFKTYTLLVKDLADIFNISGNSFYERIEDSIIRLRKKDVIIKEKKRILYTGWFSSALYYYKKGYFEINFDPKLKTYLLLLKECFTTYQLTNILNLKRVYSIRIYELLCQYRKIKTRTIQLEDLRAQLGLIEYDKKNNILKEKFCLYADFKKRILIPARKELEKKTDIRFEFNEKKTGRKVTAIEFFIKENVKEKELPFLFEKDKQDKEYEFNKLKVNIAVADMIKATNDKKSEAFYCKVAWAFILANKESDLKQALSELQSDMEHARNKGAAFTKIVTRIATEANVNIKKKT